MYKIFKKYNIFHWNDDTYWVKGIPDDVKLKCLIEPILIIIGGIIISTSIILGSILIFELTK